MTGTAIAFTLLYIFLGLLMFFGVWKEFERDDIDLYNQTRPTRIAIRICAIVLWPILFLMIFVSFVWHILEDFWDSLIE